MIRMRWMYTLTPALVLFAAGCASSSPPAASPAGTAAAGAQGAEDDEATADLKEHHRHHHHGGFAMFIAMSLDSLGTTPEQTAAIEKIQADMHTKLQPSHDAEKALLLVLADGIAAGQIDQAKVDAAITQVSAASAGVHDAVADSLNQLHATLTPQQRAALVDKVEAHFDVWHQANTEEEGAEKEGHGHLAKLAKELSLSPDQVEKTRGSLKASGGGTHFDKAEGDAHLKAFGTAFASEKFDAKQLTTGATANAHIATWGATRLAHLYEALTPVLTPEQRTKLADALRKHANYKRTQTTT
jgi:Spy/CpxP family protein refolding chaperone